MLEYGVINPCYKCSSYHGVCVQFSSFDHHSQSFSHSFRCNLGFDQIEQISQVVNTAGKTLIRNAIIFAKNIDNFLGKITKKVPKIATLNQKIFK